jgi:hypothetical protein
MTHDLTGGQAAQLGGAPMSRKRFLQLTGAATTAAFAGGGGLLQPAAAVAAGPQARPEVAAFYFPQWHVDPLNEYWFGRGWSEWELVKRAQPRYAGHQQPKVPAWGMPDEAQPSVMARKIDAAADHGVDAFMFDWYWYTTGTGSWGPYLHRCLEDGLLRAPNVNRIKFALMWANHDWNNLFPVHRANPVNTLKVGNTTLFGAQVPASFDALTTYVVEKYMTHPSYWRVGGGAYFSIYQIEKFLDGFGRDVGAARAALDAFRAKARAAGVGELHLNCMTVDCEPFVPDSHPRSMANRNKLVAQLGMDSHTTYVWIHHSPFTRFPETAYPEMRAHAATVWDTLTRGLDRPYFPNVTMGWDSSPRTVQSDVWENLGYPWTPVLGGNTPQEFETALRSARDFALANASPPIVTVNAWNEWTEGSYLEPDEQHGNGYLNAIRRVFGVRKGA